MVSLDCSHARNLRTADRQDRKVLDHVSVNYCNRSLNPNLVIDYLDITVNVKPVVLAGEDNATILHQGHVETLGVLHLAF